MGVKIKKSSGISGIPIMNMIGKIFGKLTVVSEGQKTNRRVRRWLCLCQCGNTVNVTTYNLVHGISKSCRCLGREQDLSGKKFGKLIVIKRAMRTPQHKEWECLCDCGNTVIIRANHLKTGNTTSCGCAKKIQEKINLGNIHCLDRDLIEKNRIYSNYRRGARKRHLDFNLTKEEFFSIAKDRCHYCGGEPISNFGFNGIDRVNNSVGYVKENCVPCCSICNMAKKEMNVKDFISWGIKLGNHIESIGYGVS
jgi:hypothetical protein